MEIFLTPEAQKQYHHFSENDRTKIVKNLHALKSDPWFGKKLTSRFENLYSLKAWPYRIIYSINKIKQEIWIVSILHRQGAYQ